MLAGLAGTLAYTLVLRGVAMREGIQGSRWAWHEAHPAHGPTAVIAGRFWQLIFGRSLSPSRQQRLGYLLHWSYGAAGGALLALVRRRQPMSRPVAGSALALFITAISLLLEPRLKIPGRQPPALSLAAHVIYGWVTASLLPEAEHPPVFF